MAILNRDSIIAGLGSGVDMTPIFKTAVAGTLTAAQLRSLWTGTGNPAVGVAPTAAVVPTEATVGAFMLTDATSPVSNYLGQMSLANLTGSGTTCDIRDRLEHAGGLSGTVTTAQTISGMDLSSGGPSAARRGAANYSEVQWYLEWYTLTGTTAVTATVAVTYDDASTGNVSVAVPSSAAAGLMLPILSAVAGRYIRGVTGVTLSATTGTAGNFGVTATRVRVTIPLNVVNIATALDWAQLGLAEVPNDSCLFLTVTGGTAAMTLSGYTKIIHG